MCLVHFIFTTCYNENSVTHQNPAPLLQTFGTRRDINGFSRRRSAFRTKVWLLQQELLSEKQIHTHTHTRATMWLLIFLAWVVIWAGGTYWYLFGKPSPFSLESVRPPAPREFDQKKRDKVLKQGKATAKVCSFGDGVMTLVWPFGLSLYRN